MSLKQFADTLPDYAKDLRLNLGSILSDQLMGEERKLSLLLACAHGSGYRPLLAGATKVEHQPALFVNRQPPRDLQPTGCPRAVRLSAQSDRMPKRAVCQRKNDCSVMKFC